MFCLDSAEDAFEATGERIAGTVQSTDDQLTIEKLVGLSSVDGVGCERSDELEGVDLAGGGRWMWR